MINQSHESFRYFFQNAYSHAIRWKAYVFVLVFLILGTIACTQVAMLNILAYEFSAVIGVLVANFTAILVIREFERLRPGLEYRSPYTTGPHSRIVVWGVILGSLAASGWLLLLPLAEIVLLGLVLKIRNCDQLTGLGFYLTIPILSSFFTASIAAFCAQVTKTRSQAGWLYTGILFVFLIRIILRLARGHVMSLHDPIAGTLMLPLYEQEANLESGYMFSRMLVLAISILAANLAIMLSDERFQVFSLKNLFANFRKPDLFLPEIQASILLLILAALGFYYQGPLGIEITRNYLESRLDGVAETEHFIIRYPAGGQVEDDIDRIAEETEYYYYSIVNEINVAPNGMIRGYIYPDRATKTFLTGAGGNVYAKPWTGEIHVEYDRNRIWALKHELVHVISAPMGIPFFGSSLLGAYGEGIAEGIQYDTGNDLTYHQWAAALREAEDPYTHAPFFPRDIAPRNLLTRNIREGGFYVGRIGMNYYLSASYTRWFLDTYGPTAYATAYITNNTDAAIGLDQTDTAKTWMDYLDHVPLREEEIAFARLAFSPPKFTVTVCAHELSQHERLANEYMTLSSWNDALEEYRILLDFSHQNPRYGYQTAKILFYDDRFEDALAMISTMRGWESVDESWESYLRLLEGDIYARTEQPAVAAAAYQEVRDNALSLSFRETAIIRMEILASPATDDLLAAMKETENKRWRYERARESDQTWLPLYFLGTDLIAERMYDDAEQMFLECLRLDPPFPFVKRNCLFYLGICAYRGEEYDLARTNFRNAGQIAGEIFTEEHPSYDGVIPLNRLDSWSASIADWIERCTWRADWDGIQVGGAG